MIDKDLFIENTKAMIENDNCGLVSDGDHSFNDLYHHRAILTASLFNCNKDICWKSKLHDTGDMFDGYFILDRLYFCSQYRPSIRADFGRTIMRGETL